MLWIYDDNRGVWTNVAGTAYHSFGFAFGQRTASTAISLEAVPSDDLIPIAWNGMYKVVTEVNAFLESLDKKQFERYNKVQMGGEAKFLRGLAYYNLVSLFGDVPLKTAASSSDGISVPRSPRKLRFWLW